MKHKLTTVIALVLVALFIAACGNGGSEVIQEEYVIIEITVDNNGVASWEPVKGAVMYAYCIVDGDHTSLGEEFTDEPSVQLLPGTRVDMRPIMENGEEGDWSSSAYFGEPMSVYAEMAQEERDRLQQEWEAEADARAEEERLAQEEWQKQQEAILNMPRLLDRHFTLTEADFTPYEVIANINYDTVKTSGSTVTFEANGPHGTPIRFQGEGVTVGDGTLTFAPGSRLASLGSIGRVGYVRWSTHEPGDLENAMSFSGAYTFTDATSVSSIDELYIARGFGAHVAMFEDIGALSSMWQQGNMFVYAASDYNIDSFTLDSLTVGFDTARFTTPIRGVMLDSEFYGQYLAGERYDPKKEIYNAKKGQFIFHLGIHPELLDIAEGTDVDFILSAYDYGTSVVDCLDTDSGKFTIGNLLDAEGNVVDKQNATVEVGSSLEIEVQGKQFHLRLPVYDRKAGLDSINTINPYPMPNPTGELNALVIPIAWQDQSENATDAELDLFRKQLGRTADLGGTATDYAENDYAFSRYFDLASYGKLSITSHMTDWYQAPYDFAAVKDYPAGDETFIAEVTDWLYQTYPNTDWSRFDLDADGCFDAVFLLNAGKDDDGSYQMASWEAGVFTSGTKDPSRIGTPDRPKINGAASINISMMTNAENVLVHEFGHTLGLIDYYDVKYKGVDAVGSFDMQSNNEGDWNAYSKYSVGWLEPTVVENLASGESVEVTIGSMTKTGDAIVIPAVDQVHDGPFGEYMLVDLYTNEGLYAPYGKNFGLSDKAGVRIYHVNSTMVEMDSYVYDGSEPYGKSRANVISQVAVNAFNAEGKYHIELLQNGGKNTFTKRNGRTSVNASDLFYAGDSFIAEDYSAFLPNGRMDNNVPFGYRVEIVSIEKDASGEYQATVRITRP